MAKMSKSQTRKRLEEARIKLDKVYVYGNLHLTTACKNDIVKMSSKLGTLIRKMK